MLVTRNPLAIHETSQKFQSKEEETHKRNKGGPWDFCSGDVTSYPNRVLNATHTHTRVLLSVTMADLQMKLLRKKIQKRNEKNKKRQQIKKHTEDEDTGTRCKDGVLRLMSIVLGFFFLLSRLLANFTC